MSESKDFHIGDILSITTGRLVAPRKIEAIYDILNYMTGESLYTHQLGRGMEECKPALLNQFPEFRDILVPDLDANTWERWINKQASIYGEWHKVRPLAKREAKYDTPIADLVEKVGPERVTVVEP